MPIPGQEKYKCPVVYTLNQIEGKWKLPILYYLIHHKVMRYGELKKSIEGITHKMLSRQLKELESSGLIQRREYPQIPPRVEYTLTEKSANLLPVLAMMDDWGKKNML